MFSSLLVRSLQIGDKVFHVLSNPNLTPDEWEKLGAEIIKDAALIKQKIEEQQAKIKQDLPATDESKDDPKPAE